MRCTTRTPPGGCVMTAQVIALPLKRVRRGERRAERNQPNQPNQEVLLSTLDYTPAQGRVYEALEARDCRPRRNSGLCPAHDDHNPSLAIGYGTRSEVGCV